MKKIFFLSLFLCSIIACQSQQSAETPVVQPVKVKVAAPTFKVPSHYKGTIPAEGLPIPTDYPYNIALTDADGNELNTSEVFKKNGKPTVVLFWLTTCYPCGLELKALKAKFPQWQKEEDFNFYAISTDFKKNYGNFAKRVKSSGWEFEAYHDTNRAFAKMIPGNLNGLPQVFIYDADGNIVYHKRKYSMGDEDKLFEKVKSL